jgi:hypothetical protein
MGQNCPQVHSLSFFRLAKYMNRYSILELQTCPPLVTTQIYPLPKLPEPGDFPGQD